VIEPRVVTLAEAHAMVRRGEILDMKSVVGLMLAAGSSLTADSPARLGCRSRLDVRGLRQLRASRGCTRLGQRQRDHLVDRRDEVDRHVAPQLVVRSSLTFLSFCRGRMTWRIPSRRAASTFSFTPPTGSTRPTA